MNLTRRTGEWLGLENVDAVESVRLTFGAPWAQQTGVWLISGSLLLLTLSFLFYGRYQRIVAPSVRMALATFRGLLLVLILLILADPVVSARIVSHPRPQLWLLFDGTDSMAIEDDLSTEARTEFIESVGGPAQVNSTTRPLTRQESVRLWVQRPSDNVLQQLHQKYRLKAFRFDRQDGVQTLELKETTGGSLDTGSLDTGSLDTAALAEQLTTTGQVTAIGTALEDLALRHASGQLSGILMFSDFAQNTGPNALAPAKRLNVPISTVGVGPEVAVDLAVDLQAPLLMKKAERATLIALVRQTGLTGQAVTVTLRGRPLASETGMATRETVIATQNLILQDQLQPVEFPYEPTQTGRFLFSASIEPVASEIIQQNNRAERETNIRDDFLRLMFVEYEPTWEWRFIKEVFHRDPLVGMRGFRTYLRSADPKVRETNELFLPTLTPRRSDFFANDVIFLGDMPASTLNARFCEMTREFVNTFGGGLVIIAGPRFGPAELADTPLADMLPVVIDPDSRLNDQHEFQLELTPEGRIEDFMQLGETAADNERAWRNLGRLPWYQPVARVHPLGTTVLALHPTDRTMDQKSRQPLIAVRRYGKGQVIYVGFNETWRLRRKYGEQYYRQFWGQMIHRLGLSHALGSQKRFVVRTDRPQYQADDQVTLTVEAFDENYEPLSVERFAEQKLQGTLYRPNTANSRQAEPQTLSITPLREGIFETRIPVFDAGEYRVTVTDPITNEPTEAFFQVTGLSAERRSAVRNVALQNQLATTTGGQSYSLATADRFLQDFQPVPRTEVSIETIEIWNTWLCFALVMALMFGEWLVRKAYHLT